MNFCLAFVLLFTVLSRLELGGERGGVPLGVNVLAGLEGLFPSDDLSDTLDEDVDQLGLGLAQAVGVGDVPGAASGGGVDTSGTTGLEAHLGKGLLEVGTARDQWHLDHGAGTEVKFKSNTAKL